MTAHLSPEDRDEWEWAVRFTPDGNNHIQRDEQSARVLAAEVDGAVLLRRLVTRVRWEEVPQ